MDQSSSFPMPPGPFQDFEFSFPSSSANTNFLPPGGPPPSAPLHFDFNFPTGHDQKDDMFNLNMMSSQTPLLSPTEQTNILGFLDAFDWDFNPTLPQGMPTFNASRIGRSTADHPIMAPEGEVSRLASMGRLPSSAVQETSGARAILDVATLQHSQHPPHQSAVLPPPPNSEVKTSPSLSNPATHTLHSSSSTPSQISIQPAPKDDDGLPSRPTKRRKSSPSLISVDLSGASTPPSSEKAEKSAASRKPLLTQPQKRLNHIMSEQRRRNAIKEGYATIEKLIAPAPEYAGPLPTLSSVGEDKNGPAGGKARGRSKGKGRGKGKMGTLFRAVEYCQFLEESVAALRAECERLEGITRMVNPGSNNNHPYNHMSVGPTSHTKLDALFKFAIPMD